MQVFKFGGASIKDAIAVKNVGKVIQQYGEKPLVVVVSAMGKTTRALEDLLIHKDDSFFEPKWNELKTFHFEIMKDLFPSTHSVFIEIDTRFAELKQLHYKVKDSVLLHAQVVSFGELFSSIIIANYLNQLGNVAKWLYAPDVIATTKLFSEGEVNWEETTHNIRKDVLPLLKDKIIITQGYIASSKEGVITLGKEGSDFSAAIFAACLNASKVTIWKDVPGILNADPKEVKNPSQFFKLPYHEASEMTYYGASVIHPKTIKPLATHKIPLIVRSFTNPNAAPTIIYEGALITLEPSVIYKRNQCLVSFKVKDFTFVDEAHLATIFKLLHELNLPINMMQNSAISISVCFTYDKAKVDKLLDALQSTFEIYYNTNLKLITIKNYTPYALSEYTPPKASVLIEQRTRNNYRALIKE